MSGIVLKATVNIRARGSGRFPPGSYVAALAPARASLVRDVQRAFETASDPVTGRPWPLRKSLYPWPPLVKTGLMRTGAIAAAAGAVINGNTLTARVAYPRYAKYQARTRRFLGASIGTVRIVQAGLVREGRAHAVRVLRGKRG